VVLPDGVIWQFVNACSAHDTRLGDFMHTLAETGNRPSQLARLLVADLYAGEQPKLAMPKSGKGGSKDRERRKQQRFWVPISVELARKLKVASVGRAGHEYLLLQADGRPWGPDPSQAYHEACRRIIAGLGLDPDVVSPYSLRHSCITRLLLASVPVRVVAANCDTSISQIEKHYSALIADHSDAIARAALLAPAPAGTENVVAIR
jgi:integrase